MVDGNLLNKKNARSCIGSHWFLSKDVEVPKDNGAILNITQVIKAVMSSATKAELGGLYIIVCEAVYIQKIL